MIEQIIKKLENKNVAILGFGREGKSTYSFLRKYCMEMPLTIIDRNEAVLENDLLKKDSNVNIIVGEHYLDNLEKYDYIIKTPGISLKDIDTTMILSKLTSQIELVLEVASDRIIGITGTKGKSTTSSLIYEILKEQRQNVVLAGNIGIPVLSVLEECNENTIFVMEMSSHQLEYIRKSPHIGIILNLFEDHLDHAGTIEHYHQIKMNMFQYQKREDIHIYCSDNENLNRLVKENSYLSTPYKVNIEGTDPTATIYKKENWVYYNHIPIYNTDSERNLLGKHNLENIMVALLVSELLKLDRNQTLKTIQNFKPLDYRLQFVGKVNNVDYYMDTLATIPEATLASIETLENVNTLIFGGMDRGISYDKFILELQKSKVEHFICMPTTGHKIGKSLPEEKVFYVDTLKEAVRLAKKITTPKTICLLSPAATSFEQFKNYQEKGDKYREYVLQQKEEEGNEK